jgi:hypothetical protein
MRPTETLFDVAVVGGGSAGCAAAVAAARHGQQVALIERYGFLGGTGTSVLDSFYGFFTPGDNPRQVVGGIPWEVVSCLAEQGAMLLRSSSYGAGAAVTYNQEVLKVTWDHLVQQAGVTVLFHALCTDVLAIADGWQLQLATRTEGQTIQTRLVIDASGDAQPATWAGAQSEPLQPEKLQSLTTTFRVTNVDSEQANVVKHEHLVELMREASQRGYVLPRLDGSIHRTPIPGSYVANMTRISGVNPLVPEELSKAEMEGRCQAMEYVRFLHDCVPGYRQATLDWLSTQIGVRESRRVLGEYTLTREDVLQARKFPDGVALCGAPIEDHHFGSGTRWEYLPARAAVEIPLRCLIPRSVSNLIVAGRCLSASHDAHAAVRSMGQCMAMGQAAGTAAAQALNEDVDLRNLDVKRLRSTLVADGVILA